MSHFDTRILRILLTLLIALPARASTGQMRMLREDSSSTVSSTLGTPATTPLETSLPRPEPTPVTVKTSKSKAAAAPAKKSGINPLLIAVPALAAVGGLAWLASSSSKKDGKAQVASLEKTTDTLPAVQASGAVTSSEAPRTNFYDTLEKYQGSNRLEACGSLPASVQTALQETRAYQNSCSLAKQTAGKKFVINDYSTSGVPFLYLFSPAGECLGKTPVTFGNGSGNTSPLPCSTDHSHLTPPGFHVTGHHDGATYGKEISIGLYGLEGQGSRARTILIHPAETPGTASSWGCSGVQNDIFFYLKQTLGEGSLVYNHFGSISPPRSCGSRAGWGSDHKVCQMDPPGRMKQKSTGRLAQGASRGARRN